MKLKEDRKSLLQDLLQNREDGRIKLFTVNTILQLRNKFSSLFNEGTYIPLTISGKHKESILAFARKKENQAIVVAAPRFLTKVVSSGQLPIGDQVWGDTAIELPDGLSTISWTNAFSAKQVNSDKKLLVKELYKEFPLGLLIHA